METDMITLTNDFHGTEVRVRVPAATWELTARQIARVRRALCGIPGCTCNHDNAGCRIKQVETRPDGTGYVI